MLNVRLGRLHQLLGQPQSGVSGTLTGDSKGWHLRFVSVDKSHALGNQRLCFHSLLWPETNSDELDPDLEETPKSCCLRLDTEEMERVTLPGEMESLHVPDGAGISFQMPLKSNR